MDEEQLARLNGRQHLTAMLSLVNAEDGGRKTPVLGGYRPNFWTGKFLDGAALGAHMELVSRDSLAPGETSAILLFPFFPETWQGVRTGAVVPVSEGKRLVGAATITSEMRTFDSNAYRDPS